MRALVRPLHVKLCHTVRKTEKTNALNHKPALTANLELHAKEELIEVLLQELIAQVDEQLPIRLKDVGHERF